MDGRVLDSELQQLGLPKEHAASTGRVFSAEKSRLAAALSLTSLRLTSCVEVARCGVERLQGSDAPDLEMVELVLTYKFDATLNNPECQKLLLLFFQVVL